MSVSPLTFALELLMIAIAGLYGAGALRVWRRAGLGRGLQFWRAACFLGGMLLLSMAVAGPMDRLAERSFAAHMLQHVLLMKAVPPLLLLGGFPVAFLHAAKGTAAHEVVSAWRRSRLLRPAWTKITTPWFAWSFFALSMWVWHAPPFYEAALHGEWLHVLEHAIFLGSSLLFWWYVLQPGAERPVRYGTIVLYLFTTLLHESALGALLTFSASSWYPFYSAAGPWAPGPLADQQLAGLIMWIPGGLLFGLLMVFYFGAWLHAIEQRMQTAHPEYAPLGDGHD